MKKNVVVSAKSGFAFLVMLDELEVADERPSAGAYARPPNRYQRHELLLAEDLDWTTPYTCTEIENRENPETEVEHIVALAEAYRSGVSNEALREMSVDTDNLTVATPAENRHRKGDKDAAEYLPPRNKCWFAGRVVIVKDKYDASVNVEERDALRSVLRNCAVSDVEMPWCDWPL